MPHISCWSDSSYSTSNTIVSHVGREVGEAQSEIDRIKWKAESVQIIPYYWGEKIWCQQQERHC